MKLRCLTITFLFTCGLIVAMPQDFVSCEPLFHTDERYQSVLIKEVLSTDLLILESGEKIRLIGLKALPLPEKKEIKTDEHGIIIREASPLIPLNERALYYVKDLLEGQHVRLEFDDLRKDNDYSTFAYAFLKDGSFVNSLVLENGYAQLRIVVPNTKYADQLRQAYREARKEKRGIQGN